MEYYIMKLYEKRKNDATLKLGFNRFSKKNKRVVAFYLLLCFYHYFDPTDEAIPLINGNNGIIYEL